MPCTSPESPASEDLGRGEVPGGIEMTTRSARLTRAAALAAVAALASTGAIAASAPKPAAEIKPVPGDFTLLNVSYDPTRELFQDFNQAFAARWKAKGG